jgi:hypothetical protein
VTTYLAVQPAMTAVVERRRRRRTRRKRPTGLKMDWGLELVHTCCGAWVVWLSCRVVVSGCRVGLSCRVVVCWLSCSGGRVLVVVFGGRVLVVVCWWSCVGGRVLGVVCWWSCSVSSLTPILPSSQSPLTPILQIPPHSHPANPPSPPSTSSSQSSLDLIVPVLPRPHRPNRPKSSPNFSPQSIDRITRLTWCRSSWQQESVAGWMDARRQSAFNLTFSATLGAQIAAPTRDGVEIELWFGVSDLSRLPDAHRRQKVASASLAMRRHVRRQDIKPSLWSGRDPKTALPRNGVGCRP